MRHPWTLSGLFFLSGISTLLYQIAWQRALLDILGVQSASIAIVVSAFLAGLGIGSLLGGLIARTHRISLLLVFCTFELLLGGFGAFSLDVLDQVEALCSNATHDETYAIAFGFVLMPTLLMGATLPILTAYTVGDGPDAGGRAMARLYTANTCGASVGCSLAALWSIAALGLDGTVHLAATTNALVALGALAVARRTRLDPPPPEGATVTRDEQAKTRSLAPMMGVAALIGTVSLGYEIIWARVYGVLTGGHPKAFPTLLAMLLAGTAIGAWRARQASASNRELHTLGWLMLAGSMIGACVIPTLALVPHMADIIVLLSGLSFAAFGACLPKLVHSCVRTRAQAGPRVGMLYGANLAGAVAGPLCVGLWAMNQLSTATINSMLLALGCAGAAMLFANDDRPENRACAYATLALGGALAAGLAAGLGDTLYPRLMAERLKHLKQPTTIIERAQGVIAITSDAVVFGGGAYEGMAHIDLAGNDRNRIVRPFMLSAFHPEPRKILMIGLGSGAWAQVIAHHPDVQSLTIIEIHPEYQSVVAMHDTTRSLLANPKVRIVTDDARRWLRRHREQRFDAVIMNAISHWRVHASSLLSREMIARVHARLAPGGVYLYNITSSDVAARTAALATEHVGRILDMIVIAKAPNTLVPDAARLAHVLSSYRIDAEPVLDLAKPSHRRRLDTILALLDPSTGTNAWRTREDILSKTEGLDSITDRNLRSEWPTHELD